MDFEREALRGRMESFSPVLVEINERRAEIERARDERALVAARVAKALERRLPAVLEALDQALMSEDIRIRLQAAEMIFVRVIPKVRTATVLDEDDGEGVIDLPETNDLRAEIERLRGNG